MDESIKRGTIKIVAGRVGPHLTEYGQTRRVSLVGVATDASGKDVRVDIVGIVDIAQEIEGQFSVSEGDPRDLLPRNYDGSLPFPENIVGTPGCGKTALVEQLKAADRIEERVRAEREGETS